MMTLTASIGGLSGERGDVWWLARARARDRGRFGWNARGQCSRRATSRRTPKGIDSRSAAKTCSATDVSAGAVDLLTRRASCRGGATFLAEAQQPNCERRAVASRFTSAADLSFPFNSDPADALRVVNWSARVKRL